MGFFFATNYNFFVHRSTQLQIISKFIFYFPNFMKINKNDVLIIYLLVHVIKLNRFLFVSRTAVQIKIYIHVPITNSKERIRSHRI